MSRIFFKSKYFLSATGWSGFFLVGVLFVLPTESMAMESGGGGESVIELTKEQSEECDKSKDKNQMAFCVSMKMQANFKEKAAADAAKAAQAAVPVIVEPKVCDAEEIKIGFKSALDKVKKDYNEVYKQTDNSKIANLKDKASAKCIKSFNSLFANLREYTKCSDGVSSAEKVKYAEKNMLPMCSTGGEGGRSQTVDDAMEAKALIEGNAGDSAETTTSMLGAVNETCVDQSGGVQFCNRNVLGFTENYYKDGYGGTYDTYEGATSDQVVRSAVPTAKIEASKVIKSRVDEAKNGDGDEITQSLSDATAAQPQQPAAPAPVAAAQPVAAIPATTTPSTGSSSPAFASAGVSGSTLNPYGNSFLDQSQTSASNGASRTVASATDYSGDETTSGSGGSASGGFGSPSALRSASPSSGSSEAVNSSVGGNSGAGTASFLGASDASGDRAPSALKTASSGASDERVAVEGGATGFYKPSAAGNGDLGKSSLAASSTKKIALIKKGSQRQVSRACRPGDLQCVANKIAAKKRTAQMRRSGRGIASVGSFPSEVGTGTKDILSTMAQFYDKQFVLDENGLLAD